MHYIIHQADLFRPHMDPDDHWDIALEYALQANKLCDLSAILLDCPPAGENLVPDTDAIDILNKFINKDIPFGISSRYYNSTPKNCLTAEELLINTIESSPEPVAIHICGSCTDIANIATKYTDLFNKKCRGIYLNAGAYNDQKDIEYNVALDIDSYCKIFSLKCPVYWIPCFEKCSDYFTGESGMHSSFFRFYDTSALNEFSPNVKKYFIYMYKQLYPADKTDFFSYSDEIINDEISLLNGRIRNMWCAAGIFHAAGFNILKNGSLSPTKENNHNSVFYFEPIKIKSVKNGKIKWDYDVQGNSNIYIFTKKHPQYYKTAMPQAIIDTIKLLK